MCVDTNPVQHIRLCPEIDTSTKHHPLCGDVGAHSPHPPPAPIATSPPVHQVGSDLVQGGWGLSVLVGALAAKAPSVGLGVVALRACEVAASFAPEHVHVVVLAE